MKFLPPVGTPEERQARAVWPGAWYDATNFGARTVKGYVQTYGHYHTGVDLNLPSQADIHKPVFPILDGLVVVSKLLPVWGNVCVIQHSPTLWGRYAHLIELTKKPGDWVGQYDAIGLIAKKGEGHNYSDHLHFDAARIDLKAKPTDWPGADLARLLRDYYDPYKLLVGGYEKRQYRVTGQRGVNVRTRPDTITSDIVGTFAPYTKFEALVYDDKWLILDSVVQAGNVPVPSSSRPLYVSRSLVGVIEE